MKTIVKKLSALLLCLLCLFPMLACCETTQDSTPPPAPTIGEKVKTEYLTYDIDIWESKEHAYVRLIPLCDIENLVIVIKVYNAEKQLLKQYVREMGDVVGQQGIVFIVTSLDSFYDNNVLDSIVIEAKSGTVTGI